MKSAIVAVLIFISTALLAQDTSGAICVAPIPHEPPSTAGTPELFCKSGNFSFRFDSQKPVAWPKDKSTNVTRLDLKGGHRIVVFCDGKPQQSFKFRLSEYKTGVPVPERSVLDGPAMGAEASALVQVQTVVVAKSSH